MKKLALFIIMLCVGSAIAAPLTTTNGGDRRIISLNGPWNCEESTAANKDNLPATWGHTIPVPGLADQAAPSLSKYDYLFYSTTFTVVGSVPNVAQLKINKAMFGTKVWLNGALVGTHDPCFTPGYFDLKPYVAGNGQPNTLVVRVGKINTLPKGVCNGDDYTIRIHDYPGIYDNVTVLLDGGQHIDKVQTAPNLSNHTLRVVASILNKTGTKATIPVTLEVREVSTGKLVGSARVSITLDNSASGNMDTSVSISPCTYWTPENPFLYQLQIKTENDSFTTKVGMRTFQFDSLTKKPMLNGKIYMLRGTNIAMLRFFEDSERAKLPWDKAWARAIIRLYKGLNLNSLRFHVGFAPEIWYEVCDEEGFLVDDEYPIWGMSPPLKNGITASSMRQEITDWIYDRNNHPCLYLWDMCNEHYSKKKSSETAKMVAENRSTDIQNRPWQNSAGFNEPTDPNEEHPYFQSGKPMWFPDDLYGRDLVDPSVIPANPVDLNEYGWTWLNRDGSPNVGWAASDKDFYAVHCPSGLVADRRYYRAYELAIETEFHRACRFSSVKYFLGLNFSRYSDATGGIGQSNTSDDLQLGIANPRFEANFQSFMKDAFAPVGVMIGYWHSLQKTRETVTIPVYISNDTSSPWTGDVSLKIMQGSAELSNVAQTFTNVPTGYRSSMNYTITFPNVEGPYQLIAQYTDGGTTVKSVRDVAVSDHVKIWESSSGKLARVSVATNGHIWGVSSSGAVFQCTGKDWTQMKSSGAKDIGCGADGIVAICNTDGSIQKWDGSTWITNSGSAVSIDVASNGDLWVVNAKGEVWKYCSSTWTQMKSSGAKDVGCGADGTIAITNTDGTIQKWSGSSWTTISGTAVSIDVADNGDLWVVNSARELLLFRGTSWFKMMTGINDVGCGANNKTVIADKSANVFVYQ